MLPPRPFLRPFMPIKLKKAPPKLARTFPSEIRTAQAAIKFVNSLDPKTLAKLHWKLAASALAALDTGAIRQGDYDRANKAMRNGPGDRMLAGRLKMGDSSNADARLRGVEGRDAAASGELTARKP
jgi:hypothetical protein